MCHNISRFNTKLYQEEEVHVGRFKGPHGRGSSRGSLVVQFRVSKAKPQPEGPGGRPELSVWVHPRNK
jgi:hypothetical protein